MRNAGIPDICKSSLVRTLSFPVQTLCLRCILPHYPTAVPAQKLRPRKNSFLSKGADRSCTASLSCSSSTKPHIPSRKSFLKSRCIITCQPVKRMNCRIIKHVRHPIYRTASFWGTAAGFLFCIFCFQRTWIISSACHI